MTSLLPSMRCVLPKRSAFLHPKGSISYRRCFGCCHTRRDRTVSMFACRFVMLRAATHGAFDARPDENGRQGKHNAAQKSKVCIASRYSHDAHSTQAVRI